MFHWICPECGREIPPSVKECAACDPKAQTAPVAAVPPPVVAAPPPVAAVPPPIAVPVAVPAPDPEPAPDPLLALAEHIRSAQSRVAAVETPAPPPLPAETAAKAPSVELPAAKFKPEPEPEVVSAGVAELARVVGIAEPEPQPEPQPAPQATSQETTQAPAQESAPEISITQFFPKTQAVALLAPPEVLAAPAEIPVAPVVAEPLPEQKPLPENPTPPVVTELAAPAPESPAVERPPSGTWLQLAPLQDYISTASRTMRPASPRREILSPDSGPRITLPGPTLPPYLASLKNASVVTVIGNPRSARAKLPGWVVSAMLMLGIPLAGGVLLLYFQPIQHSSAEAKAPAAPQSVAAPTPAPAQAAHSLADFVEVTGFRFVVDFNKKSEIHYLVVNHSAAELSDMTVFVTLHAADAKPGQPPLCRFSFRAPGLAAFESKEMTSPIEKLTRAVVLPDWQDLRADVQIGQ